MECIGAYEERVKAGAIVEEAREQQSRGLMARWEGVAVAPDKDLRQSRSMSRHTRSASAHCGGREHHAVHTHWSGEERERVRSSPRAHCSRCRHERMPGKGHFTGHAIAQEGDA